MSSPIKYSYELLNTFCIEKNVKLAKDYSSEKLFGSTKISFYCTMCNKENIKCFTYLIKRNSLCKSCVTIQSLPKQKETMLKKYGVEHASQNEEIRNKTKLGFVKKYGVDNPSKLEEIKEKTKITNLKKYGVEFTVQNKEIKEKMIKTNLYKYGSECCLQNINIKEKIKQTNLQKYGFENVGQNLEIQQKMKTTLTNNYGVNYPLQNSEIAENASHKCYKQKFFICPSGKEIKCQGYEPFALKELIDLNISEDDIVTGSKNVPIIWYFDKNQNKRRHYVDIFIPSKNKCIEVKSSWTLNKETSNIFEKQDEAKKLGYNYEIWVYDNKGNKINVYL
jgi:hypothetical protein